MYHIYMHIYVCVYIYIYIIIRWVPKMMVPQDIQKPLFFTNDFMLHDLPPSSKNPRNGHVLPSNFLCSLARFFACASDGRIGTCWTRSPPSAWNLCMTEKKQTRCFAALNVRFGDFRFSKPPMSGLNMF